MCPWPECIFRSLLQFLVSIAPYMILKIIRQCWLVIIGIRLNEIPQKGAMYAGKTYHYIFNDLYASIGGQSVKMIPISNNMLVVNKINTGSGNTEEVHRTCVYMF